MMTTLLTFDDFKRLHPGMKEQELVACWFRVNVRREGKDYLEQKKLITEE